MYCPPLQPLTVTKCYLGTDRQGLQEAKPNQRRKRKHAALSKRSKPLWYIYNSGTDGYSDITQTLQAKKLRCVIPYNMYIYNQHGSLTQKHWHTWFVRKKPCMYMQSSYWETADAVKTQNKENQKIHQWFEAVTKLFWSTFQRIFRQRIESYHGLFTVSWVMMGKETKNKARVRINGGRTCWDCVICTPKPHFRSPHLGDLISWIFMKS